MTKGISDWVVDYGEEGGKKDIQVPHAWQQDVPVQWEGPALYTTEIEVPEEPSWLVFHAVSYRAVVRINGEQAADHRGLWDAFSVSLEAHKGETVTIAVEVTKNGGTTFPVKDVASGFLPFVFNTFGGIYGDVELVTGEDPLANLPPAPEARVWSDGAKVYVDDQPFYTRGLLHWGWYPEQGHTNAPEETIRDEVRKAKGLGFNLIKFCLWVPPHRYLEILKEEGMEAWLELPLWDPTNDAGHQESIAREIERIVRQYRHHDNIIIWTVGCELSASTGAEYRRYLYQMVKNLTGSPLVKDNSGGAEMYGGDLREFGDFYDFHPYCDTHFYPSVLDTLLPSARKKMPILLGEFNDIDVHRDVAMLYDQMPFWASSISELNDKGVRWQYDLPHFINDLRFSQEPTKNRHKQAMEASRRKALFIRKSVHEEVRARDAVSGYVITGLRDTPISTAGFFDDWGKPRFSPEECRPWNRETTLFLIPTRRPPWLHGGNRPGFIDPLNHFTGQIYWKIGVHSERLLQAGLVWSIKDAEGKVIAYGASDSVEAEPLESTEVGEIHWQCEQPGEYELSVDFGDASNRWNIFVVERCDCAKKTGWGKEDPAGLLDIDLPGGDNVVATRLTPAVRQAIESGALVILFLTDEDTKPMPFWREAAYEFKNEEFWQTLPLAEQWERWLPVAPDRVLDGEWLDGEVLLNRIDVRTYAEAPVVVQRGNVLVTTARPFGGHGIQPTSISKNPVGMMMLERMMTWMEGS